MNALSQAFLPQYGDTSLMKAAYKGHVEVASLLLQRGADIEAKADVRISTPLGPLYFFEILLLSWTVIPPSLPRHLSLHF